MIEATDKNLDAIIASHPLLVIDCWAPWCQPCLYFTPLLEDLSREYIDKVAFAKINVGDNKAIIKRFHLRGVPTLLIFKKGKLVEHIVGVLPRRKLEPMLMKLMEDGKKE